MRVYLCSIMKLISKQKIFDKFFAVQEVKIQNHEGEEAHPFFYVDKLQAACIILINTDTNKVVLTKQFRVPFIESNENELIELPAGVIDPGESAEECIKREVMEETGYFIQEVRKLYSFYTSPGYNNEEITLFYGKVTTKDKHNQGGGLVEEYENIEVLEFSSEECFDMIESGKILDAKTIIGLLWLKNRALTLNPSPHGEGL